MQTVFAGDEPRSQDLTQGKYVEWVCNICRYARVYMYINTHIISVYINKWWFVAEFLPPQTSFIQLCVRVGVFVQTLSPCPGRVLGPCPIFPANFLPLRKASGWFVFRHAGILNTDRGPGKWRIEEVGVTFFGREK